MSLNTEVGLWCIVLPASVACIAALISLRLNQRNGGGEDASNTSCCSGVFGASVALGWWIGLAVTMAARQWMTADDADWLTNLKGIEAWQTALWPLLLLAVVPSLVGERSTAEIRFVAAALLASGLAYVVIPSGENWDDLSNLHRPWSALITASVLLNTFSLDGLIRSGAKLWSLLVMAAGFGPAILLTSLNYAAPAEWTLAGLAGTGGILLAATWAAIRKSKTKNGSEIAVLSAAITLPVSGLIATAVTTARFYTWEDYPAWLYAIALFLPTFVCIVDFPLRRFSGKIRIPLAASTSSALIAICVWKLILQEPPESW